MDVLQTNMSEVFTSWCDDTDAADMAARPSGSRDTAETTEVRRQRIRASVLATLARDRKMIENVRSLLTPDLPGIDNALAIADQKLADLREQSDRVEGKNPAPAGARG